MFLVDLVWQSGMETQHLMTNEAAACLIQARYRGNSWRWEKKQLVATATMIQVSHPHLILILTSSSPNPHLILSQTHWRGKMARNKVDVLHNIRAGMRIQSWIRARRARIELQNSDPQLAAKLKDCRGNVDAPPAAKRAFEAAGEIMKRGPQTEAQMQRMVDLYQGAMEKGYPRKGRCLNGAVRHFSIISEFSI